MFFKWLWKWIKDTYYKISDWFKEHFTRTERTEMEENTVNETTQLLPETMEQPTQSFWKSSWNKTCSFFSSLKSRFTTMRQRIYEEERQSLERLAKSEQRLAEARKQLDEAREKRKQTQLENENQEPIEKLTWEKFWEKLDKEMDERWEREDRERQEKWDREDRERREKWDREMQELMKESREATENFRMAMEEQELRNREYINNLELFAVSVGKLVKSQARINEELIYALECTRDCLQMCNQRAIQLSNLLQHLFRENAFLRLYIYQAHMLRHRIDLYPSPQFSQRQISVIQRAITNEPRPMLEMSKEHLHE